jgi:hypothetical protein
MLTEEGEAAVPESEETVLLIIDIGRISPADFPELDLQVLEELGIHPLLLRCGSLRRPGCSLVHGEIVLTGELMAMRDRNKRYPIWGMRASPGCC